MLHVTAEEFSTLCGKQTVIELTDGKNSIDLMLLESVNALVSAEVDGYLRGIYSLPLDTESLIIKSIVVDIMLYSLNQRRNPKNISESLLISYKLAVAKLKDIQQKIILLEASEIEKDVSVQRIASRTSMQESENHINQLSDE